jgi:hypothetical protein
MFAQALDHYENIDAETLVHYQEEQQDYLNAKKKSNNLVFL